MAKEGERGGRDQAEGRRAPDSNSVFFKYRLLVYGREEEARDVVSIFISQSEKKHGVNDGYSLC